MWGGTAIQETSAVVNSSENALSTRCFCIEPDDWSTDVFVGTLDGAFAYSPLEGQTTLVFNTTVPVYCATFDLAAQNHYGFLFALTHDKWGGLYRIGVDSKESYLLNITGLSSNPDRQFNRVEACNEEPLIVLGGGSDTLYIYNITNSTTQVSEANDMLEGLLDMLCVGKEVLIGCQKGLAVYNISSNQLTEYPLYASEEYLSVNCVEYDSLTEEVYLGTSQGVFIFSRLPTELNLTRRLTEADGIVASEVTCLELDLTTEQLYIGTKFGITVYDLKSMQVRKTYYSLFSDRIQDIKDIYAYRIGRVHRLIAASGRGGLAWVCINNLPSLFEYADNNITLVGSVVTVSIAIMTLWVSGEKKVTLRVLLSCGLLVLLCLCTLWTCHLYDLQQIPNMVPPES